MNTQTIRAQGYSLTNPPNAPRADRSAIVETPMIDPTLMKMQGRRRTRRSSLMVAAPAALFVALVGGAGLFALTRPHAGAVATPSTASNAQSPSDQASASPIAAQSAAVSPQTVETAQPKVVADQAVQDRAALTEDRAAARERLHHAARAAQRRALARAEPPPAATAPVESAPVQTAPVQTAPVQTAPAPTAPVQTAPVEAAPAGAAPVEAAPALSPMTPQQASPQPTEPSPAPAPSSSTQP